MRQGSLCSGVLPLDFIGIGLCDARYRIKTLLAQQEAVFPNLFSSLSRALQPLLGDPRVTPENKIAPLVPLVGGVTRASIEQRRGWRVRQRHKGEEKSNEDEKGE